MRDHLGTTALVTLTGDLTQIRDDADCLLDIIDGLHIFRQLVEGHGRCLDIDVMGHGPTAYLHVGLEFTLAPKHFPAAGEMVDPSGDWPPATAIMAETAPSDDSHDPAAPDGCILIETDGALDPTEITRLLSPEPVPPEAEAPAQPEPTADPMCQPEPAQDAADQPEAQPESATRQPEPAADVSALAEAAAAFDPAIIQTGPYAGRYPASHPMTDAEQLRALALHASGESAGEIARALNRDPRGFYHQMNALLAETPDTPEAPPAEPAPVSPIDALSPGDRRALDRITDLGFPSIRGVTWSADMDLDIVRGQSEGLKIAEIAADLGLDPAVVKARYHQLVPTTGVEVQATILRVLQARADAGGGNG